MHLVKMKENLKLPVKDPGKCASAEYTYQYYKSWRGTLQLEAHYFNILTYGLISLIFVAFLFINLINLNVCSVTLLQVLQFHKYPFITNYMMESA